MGQIIRLVDGEGGRSRLVYESHVSEDFIRGLSLKRHLERVQHTDPDRAISEILPFRLPERQGDDAAA